MSNVVARKESTQNNSPVSTSGREHDGLFVSVSEPDLERQARYQGAGSPRRRCLRVVGLVLLLGVCALVAAWSLSLLWPGSCTDALSGRSSIPHVVFLTGPWIPTDVEMVNMRFVPPGTEFRYFDDAQMDASMREISERLEAEGVVSGAYAAFRNLRAMAFRADVWRAAVLWDQGGVYLDAKIQLAGNITNFVDFERDHLATCIDSWHTKETPAYWQAMMAGRRRDPLLSKLLAHAVTNIQSHYYGGNLSHYYGEDFEWSALMITGPGAMGVALGDLEAAEGGALRCAAAHEPDEPNKAIGVGARADLVVAVQDDKAHDGMRGCADCRTYEDLVSTHEVYCDEPSPTPCRTATSVFASYTSWVV